MCEQYISTSNIKRVKERKTNPVSFFATIVDNNWHFYSGNEDYSLRAGSQRFEVHDGPVLSAAVLQLVATSSYYNNTTIALSQMQIFKD